MVYLVAVIAMAVIFGQGPAVFASVLAFFAYDIFLIEPNYTVTVSDPSEWLSLSLLLVTAVITGQLAARQACLPGRVYKSKPGWLRTRAITLRSFGCKPPGAARTSSRSYGRSMGL